MGKQDKKYNIEFNGLDEAQKTMQKVVDTLPKLKDNLPDLEDYGEKIKLTSKNFNDWESAMISHFHQYRNEVEEGYSQIGIAATEVASKVEQLNGLNQKALKSMIETNKMKLEATAAEIESTKKLSTSVSDVIKVYTKKKEILKEQAQISIATVNEEYSRYIEAAKIAGADISQLETNKAAKIKLINKKLETDLTKVTQEEFDARKTVLDAHLKDVLNKTKKGGAEQLKHYKQLFEYTEKDQVDHYKKLEKEYRGDKEKLAIIQEEKKKVLEYYASEKKKIGESITEVEEKQSKERLEKWKKIADEFKKIADNIKNGTDAVGSGIENMFKSQVDKIDNEVKVIEDKQNELLKDNTYYHQQLSELRRKASDDAQNMTQDEIDRLNELSKKEKDNNSKNEELEKEKKEKKDKRAKVENLRRKGELIKQIGDATASVALSVTKALATGPFIGQVLASITAGIGAIQIGIMTAQLAKFEQGGLLRGKRHTQGGMRIEGTNIEVEGGEYVINRESTNKNLGLIRYINSQRRELKPQHISSFFASPSPRLHRPEYMRMFESGGQVPSMPMSPDVDAQILRAIERINFQPRVSVTDINNVQQQMVKTHDWIGI